MHITPPIHGPSRTLVATTPGSVLLLAALAELQREIHDHAQQQAAQAPADGVCNVSLRALLLRSLRGMASAEDEGRELAHSYWHGHCRALVELLDGTATALVHRDRLFGVDAQASLQTAWARLSVDGQALAGPLVQQICTAQTVQRAEDGVTHGNVHAVKQVEQHEGVVGVPHDHPATAQAGVGDGTAQVHGDIVAQRGAAC